MGSEVVSRVWMSGRGSGDVWEEGKEKKSKGRIRRTVLSIAAPAWRAYASPSFFAAPGETDSPLMLDITLWPSSVVNEMIMLACLLFLSVFFLFLLFFPTCSCCQE